MSYRRVAGAPLDFSALRAELEVPGDFGVEVLAEADASARDVTLPETDLIDIPFVTIDPPGSRDLDQAVQVERAAGAQGGYLVRYAIADVAAFVPPDSALAAESFRRGETLYFPDARVPLHPPVISEGAASLLPGQLRPALVWTLRLDADASLRSTEVRRAAVRSRAQLDYAGLQQLLDAGAAPAPVALLPEVGRLLIAAARARHAIELDLPEQRVVPAPDGGWALQTRTTLPVEKYNEQISLITGMAAARLMLDAGVGLLRVVPTPPFGAVHALRRAAHALQVPWPHDALPGDVLADLDPTQPMQAAFIDHAAALLRGSSYVAFDSGAPAHTMHAGVGAPYAHVTAPLRRLADRFAGEICLAVHAGEQVPDWVRQRLELLPAVMAHSDQLAHTAARAVVDATEAWLLQDRVGETFAATVIDADSDAASETDSETATIVLSAIAVRAPCTGTGMHPGEVISARLIDADVGRRQVRFERA
ncbi:MAG TPA: RNB domain-containing ribonuclease [Jatrophihabitantaceae bacterium]